MNKGVEIDVYGIGDVLGWNLDIDNYQRPYEWNEDDVRIFLCDLESAICSENGVKYRLGNIILHSKENEKNHYFIVDGQQRIITLFLIRGCLIRLLSEKGYVFSSYDVGDDESKGRFGLSRKRFKNKVTLDNVLCNSKFIRGWILNKFRFLDVSSGFKVENSVFEKSSKRVSGSFDNYSIEFFKKLCSELNIRLCDISDEHGDCSVSDVSIGVNIGDGHIDSYSNILEFVVISISNISEAFQMFDSQNNRGVSLYPHDILKAYHLREVGELNKNQSLELENLIDFWENNDLKVRSLFENYLYPIQFWSNGVRCEKVFNVKDIYLYKGVNCSRDYPFVKKLKASRDIFQITEPFLSGIDFFKMVKHYVEIVDRIEGMMKNSDSMGDSSEYEQNSYLGCVDNLDCNTFDVDNVFYFEHLNSKKYKFCKKLFLSSVLFYYDRFGDFDVDVIYNLYKWSFSLRLDVEILRFESFNKYAIGEGSYSCQVAMFYEIKKASSNRDISSIVVKFNESDSIYDYMRNLRDYIKRL